MSRTPRVDQAAARGREAVARRAMRAVSIPSASSPPTALAREVDPDLAQRLGRRNGTRVNPQTRSRGVEDGVVTAREKLAALRTRRVNAAAQREQLAISLAQRAGEIDQLWAEHQALRAAIHRTCKEFDRVIGKHQSDPGRQR